MLFRSITIVFLFIIRIRFPQDQSIATIIRKRYAGNTLKDVRRLERLDKKCRKLEIDIDFLETCIRHDVIPTFVKFKVANQGIRQSNVYRKCQEEILKVELQNKSTTLIQAKEDLGTMYRKLKLTISYLDFGHIYSTITNGNERSIELIKLTQSKKLDKLLMDYNKEKPGKNIFNFSSHILTDSQTSLLSKGLNFTVPPKFLRYEDHCLPFELLFRNIQNSQKILPVENVTFFKNSLKEICFSSLRSYNKSKHKFENISEDEYYALLELKKLDNLVIQKTDKGNSVVLVDKDIYKGKIKSILNDQQKFVDLQFSEQQVLRELIDTQNRMKNVLDPLLEKGTIDKKLFDRLLPKGGQPGKIYGLCKVHKNAVDGCPPFRPILSAINTPTYNLSKFLIPILEPLTKNRYVIKDSFSFVDDIKKQDSELFMASFDVEALFTNIPLDETINICTNKLFPKRGMKVKGLIKNEFRNLLTLATKESLFLFDGIYYRQIDGVAMGSPLGPTLANIFLCFYEEKWLDQCPIQFKPKFYNRYVDDIFILFDNPNQVNKFDKYINSRHENMRFTKEIEEDKSLPFLDINIKKNRGFETSIYRKPTFSGVYLNFKSHSPLQYKKGLVNCLLFRIYNLCSNWNIIHEEITKIKKILMQNNYPLDFINHYIKLFLDKCFEKKVIVPEGEVVPLKEEFTISLPFLGNQSNMIKKQLTRTFSNLYPSAKIKVIFRSGIRIGSLFKFKDSIPSHILSLLVYKFSCSGCNSTYIGKSKRHHKVRMCEHLGISYKTGKDTKYNPKNTTAIRDHMRESGHENDFSNFEILNYGQNDLECLIKESLLIKIVSPDLNKQVKDFKLSLF